VRETNALSGESIYVGRVDERMAITAELRAEIVAENPENVGTGLLVLRRGG
jgi:hypothetical protein